MTATSLNRLHTLSVLLAVSINLEADLPFTYNRSRENEASAKHVCESENSESN